MIDPWNLAYLLCMPLVRNTPLLVAAGSNNLQAVALLLEANANIHHRNKRGGTALHAAVSTNNAELINRLIAADCELDTRTQSGRWAPFI